MTLPIVERLRGRGRPFTAAKQGFRAHCPLINPDGPEAADTIEDLVEALEFASALLRAHRESVAADDCDKILAKIGGEA